MNVPTIIIKKKVCFINLAIYTNFDSVHYCGEQELRTVVGWLMVLNKCRMWEQFTSFVGL